MQRRTQDTHTPHGGTKTRKEQGLRGGYDEKGDGDDGEEGDDGDGDND